MKFTSTPVSSFDSVSRGYRYYVLALLTLVFIVNFVDRQVLSVLIEPIKRDLQLTDTQLGLLSGLAFALFYVTAGVPIARLADLKSRRNLIAVCMIVWSSMTALCGTAANFAHLLLARIGVAVGEAGCVAPSHSILSDYFRPRDRATALSIYAAGASVGVFIGLLGGGWLAEAFGWRAALVIIGLPGIAVALVVLVTLREPRRGMSLPSQGAPSSSAPTHFWADLGRLLRRPTLVFIALAGGFQSMVTYGVATWLPAFFMRVHGMTPSRAGATLAVISGLVAGVGAIVGGSITARLSRNERRWLLWVPAIATVVATPSYAFAILSPSVSASLLCLVPAAFVSMVYVGPALAATHGVAGVSLRATGVALTLFVSNLLGIGGGALLVGVVSDAFVAAEPTVSLRYGLLAVLVANVPATIGYLLAANGVRDDWHE
ncbi:spinster family MFS transporter [Steroidobacter sp.]|uniref:spinster family MFS transporter n=1 Tax=Steroidobacter sp. TaxID=1978227 RepID=UPI001A4C7E8C|nr:MFS transporter [Steroidobacter sp.]MBL8269918.1 MFS transporter [Steroidobacter sp.]